MRSVAMVASVARAGGHDGSAIGEVGLKAILGFVVCGRYDAIQSLNVETRSNEQCYTMTPD